MLSLPDVYSRFCMMCMQHRCGTLFIFCQLWLDVLFLETTPAVCMQFILLLAWFSASGMRTCSSCLMPLVTEVLSHLHLQAW